MASSRAYANKTDEELVNLTLKDQDYFLYIMKRYEGKLSRYIMRISGVTREEAQDILQEVFIKTYRNLNDFDTSLKFSSWIYRIARNEAISAYRKSKSKKQDILIDVDDEMLDKIASDFDTSREINQEFLRKSIINILNNIDKKYREVLVLKFLEEKDYKEISYILKKPMGTIATLINRAKKEFKKEMERENINL